MSAWKWSIDQPIAIDKRISLITAIFSNRSVAEAVKHLCREDIQAFVDAVDEVLSQSSVQVKWLTDLTSCRADTGEPGTATEEEVCEQRAFRPTSRTCCEGSQLSDVDLPALHRPILFSTVLRPRRRRMVQG